jgi:two-component system response regulator HydG
MIGRVFIIDDDHDHAESIADVLEQRGYEVEVAWSGEDGARRFSEAEFDLILMDVKLPGMNGVETFAEFRKIRPDARVVMMTGYSVEQLLAQAVEDGALGVLRKPFPIVDLLDMLERVKPRGLVLVADDDPDFATSIEPVLRHHGYTVKIARTGSEALAQAAADGVNCLVLDLKLPVLSGVEVYLKLRETGRAIPTILITGFADAEHDVITRLQPVTDGLLIKPFDPADLLRAIDAALGGAPAG